MFDQKNRFVIDHCQKKPTFSSFLPGIAGPKGIPAWVYYNNRGQGVCSFGAENRDHAIMEFCPAHVGYQNNARTGFRTFVKVNGAVTEVLSLDASMHIGTAELMLEQQLPGLTAQVTYYGLPNARAAGLVRMFTLTNTGSEPLDVELLDGMSAVVCYGINQDTLKSMTQLAKAWMQTDFGESGAAHFAVRASMADTACVTQVEGVNFAYAIDETGAVLHPLVQPGLVFGQDTGLAFPETFAAAPLSELTARDQVTTNQFPCCFMPRCKTLAPGEALSVYTLYGQAENRAAVARLVAQISGPQWFQDRYAQAVALGRDLSDAVETKTADPVFDAYCRQTYVDNLLRGGTPIFFEKDGKKTPFYHYSRKHGDPEREYNYFSVGNEYYAQGNGNFRDVNQNRRCDVLFHPDLGDANIRMFFELLQTDGYNPLVIQASTFRLEAADRDALVSTLPAAVQDSARALLTGDFTPGRLAMAAEDWQLPDADGFVAACVTAAHSDPNASFGEGYWCDHWTYDLDLIESYLAVFPEKKGELLRGSRTYRWYASQAAVLPRQQRYVAAENGLRQYQSIDEEVRQRSDGKWLLTADGSRAVSTLLEKLILLGAVKASTLDAAGMGVEMEGGKPGWYDALNGLPGLFGSSMCESCELKRLLDFTIQALTELGGDVELYAEIAALLRQVGEAAGMDEPRARWDAMNEIREAYRAKTADTLCGDRVTLPAAGAAALLQAMTDMVETGIRRAEALGNGLIPTYFRFEAGPLNDQGLPETLTPYALPYFLEGPVRRLKTAMSQAEKAALHQAVAASDLYDKKLRMYKVNASLADTTFEVGRCRAFTAGWLENESIWLHMEYKYLLELLKCGLYEEFAAAFRDAAVPFLDPAVYGRSPLENVSFLASSALPDPADHGRGFVARLSGSTAEFLQIWQLMFFGPKPFTMTESGLACAFAPMVPAYLMPASGELHATFLGKIAVTYRCGGKEALIPGQYAVTAYTLTAQDGQTVRHAGPALPADLAEALRSGSFTAVEVEIG